MTEAGPPDRSTDSAGVRYRYPGDHLALDGIDLDIERGEQVCLLGANGSGKSTLLKLLDGIIGPTDGEMQALGRDVAAVAAGQDAFRFHREVGLVFQDPDIQLFSATVLDDVAFGPLQLGLTTGRGQGRVRRRARRDGDRPPGRPCPVRALRRREEAGRDRLRLSLRPDVVLLDEPTAALDPRTKSVLVDLIRRMGEPVGRSSRRRTSSRSCRSSPIGSSCSARTGESSRTGPRAAILGDRDLLLRANLIHEHLHEHVGGTPVEHSHAHVRGDDHHHGAAAEVHDHPVPVDV